jgi:hypothetical protein
MRALRVAAAAIAGVLAGITLVVACGTGPAATSAQSSVLTVNVVDGAGVVLGKLVGASPIPAISTAGLAYPNGFSFAFLDAGGRIWNVGVGGGLQSPRQAVFYASADCTGTAHSNWPSTQVPALHGADYLIASGGVVSFTAQSVIPWGGTCVAYTGTALATPRTLTQMVKVAPPTITAPVGI